MLKAVPKSGYPFHPGKHLSTADVLFLPKTISPMQHLHGRSREPFIGASGFFNPTYRR